MCGYCTEMMGLDLVRQHLVGETPSLAPALAAEMFLQMCPDVTEGARLVAGLRQHCGIQQTLAWRGLELLVLEGFTSPAYQALLAMPAYRAAIAEPSTEESRTNFLRHGSRLDVSGMDWLLKPEVFFEETALRCQFEA